MLGGSATVHFPIWHQEIEDILVLKNNKGTEDNRVRKLDYSIQISKLFYERFINEEDITLFSPHDVPGLYDAFGTDKFDAMYKKYEKDSSIKKKSIPAQELFSDLLKERAETGRIYIMNIDHANTHSSFKDKVSMSNLCQEITLPTTPISAIDDAQGEIALCILSAINVGQLNNLEDLENLCDLAVRALEEIIEYQDYPVKAAEVSTISTSNFIRVFNFNSKRLNVFEFLTMCESKLMTIVSFTFPIVLEIIYYNLIFLSFNCHMLNLTYVN